MPSVGRDLELNRATSSRRTSGLTTQNRWADECKREIVSPGVNGNPSAAARVAAQERAPSPVRGKAGEQWRHGGHAVSNPQVKRLAYGPTMRSRSLMEKQEEASPARVDAGQLPVCARTRAAVRKAAHKAAVKIDNHRSGIGFCPCGDLGMLRGLSRRDSRYFSILGWFSGQLTNAANLIQSVTKIYN